MKREISMYHVVLIIMTYILHNIKMMPIIRSLISMGLYDMRKEK